jgi:hypothetical protein
VGVDDATTGVGDAGLDTVEVGEGCVCVAQGCNAGKEGVQGLACALTGSKSAPMGLRYGNVQGYHSAIGTHLHISISCTGEVFGDPN